MITVSSIRVLPVKSNSLLIRWEFDPSFENFRDYSFKLQRSFSPEDGWDTIFEFIDDTHFKDEVLYIRMWQELYYRIIVQSISTNEIWESSSESCGHEPNMEALEIIRRNDVLLQNKRHGIGVPVAVFLRKKIGVSCDCWDQVKSRSTKSTCDDCYGTHYFGGFYKPMLVWVNFNPDNKTTVIPQWGEMEPQEGRVFMSNYPVVNPKDIIADPMNHLIYIVDGVQTSVRRMHTLHQLCAINMLDRNSTYYRLFEDYKQFMDEILEATKLIRKSG